MSMRKRIKKGTGALCLALAAVFAFSTVVYADTYVALQIDNPQMSVNGEIREIGGTPPTIRDGRSLVPLRSVVEAMGGTVEWDGEERKITISMVLPTIIIIGEGGYNFWGSRSVAEEFMERVHAFWQTDEFINRPVSWEEQAERFGAVWDDDNLSFIVEALEVTELWIDSTRATMNGIERVLDVAPTVIDGTTMVPIRFVADSFGFDTRWEERERFIVVADRELTDEFIASVVLPPSIVPAVTQPTPQPQQQQTDELSTLTVTQLEARIRAYQQAMAQLRAAGMHTHREYERLQDMLRAAVEELARRGN